MNPLDLVKLTALMELSNGRPETVIGLIDGPVAIDHPDLAGENIRKIPGQLRGICTIGNSVACMHGTFVAGILSANRDSAAPAICPKCTLLVRSIFAEVTPVNGQMPSATPKELATAIIDCVTVGTRVINLSAALVQSSSQGQRELEDALDYAAWHGVIIVAAAGNQSMVGSSAITRHPWVIPVVAYDLRGRPMNQSNVGGSIGRRGLGAPGDAVTSLSTTGNLYTLGGTSTAAPFVTGTIALLFSEFPTATATEARLAVTQTSGRRPSMVVPPLLDAWAAYQVMLTTQESR